MTKLREKAVEVVAALRRHGHQAVFAGGCVRDMLMEREPVDYDIATSARPHEVTAVFPKTVLVGAEFGVVRVIVDSCTFEVATFRTERNYTDHRHPDTVEYSDARGDVLRRDFTINAMLYDPIAEEVLDFVGGRADIAAGIVRAVGDPAHRINEDYLRMIRAVRFAARFGYEIEDATFRAIRSGADKILHVSKERIGVELLKIYGGPNARDGLRLLSETGLLRHVLPEVEAMKSVEQPANFHPEGDVFQHALLALEIMGEAASPELALGVLLHDVGKPPTYTKTDRIRFSGHEKTGAQMAGRIGRRLRLSNDQIQHIKYLVKSHMRFMSVREMRESTLKRFLREPLFDDLLELFRIDCLASHGMLDTYEFCKGKIEEFGEEEIAPPRLFTGSDLIALGYEPGPQFKEILSTVEDAQLEGRLRSKDEAAEFVREKFPRR